MRDVRVERTRSPPKGWSSRRFATKVLDGNGDPPFSRAQLNHKFLQWKDSITLPASKKLIDGTKVASAKQLIDDFVESDEWQKYNNVEIIISTVTKDSLLPFVESFRSELHFSESQIHVLTHDMTTNGSSGLLTV